jgi:virginiamycin B lyase
VGGGAVWVTDQADGLVTRIDAASNSVTTIEVGEGPAGIAFGEEAVWVANGGDGTVSRIDAETYEVETIEVGNRPSGIAVGNGAVWVTIQAPVST